MTMSRSEQLIRVLSLGVIFPLFSACSEPPPPPVETIRAIRSVTVSEPASGKMRRFSGVVEAADTSNISFEVPGNVQVVNVAVGERVAKGQALAVLDDRTFRLNVEAAETGVASAEVAVSDALNNLQRQQRIAAQDRGAITERSMEQAEAAYASARQNLSYSTSRLNLAKRDLERTTLYAPFDGVIAERHVDPFEEVNRGQKLFVLYVEGVMEAAISIPESEIDQTISDEQACQEAARCMSCGLCFDCQQCFMYCNKAGFTRVEETRPGNYFVLALDACEGCGKCIEVCPCAYLEARDV